MRGKLSLTTSVLALLCCSAVHAQTASSGNQQIASTSSGQIEEVVVTAERRTTNLQTTAISATVLSGAALAAKGVNVVDQLQFIAPSVTIDDFGQGVDFDIRGIGKGEHNSQTTPGIITYRDGVPTFPGYITEEPYYDISSIQILRGPQGTFAGQNAIGGAVFVTTQNPVIGGDYDGYVQAQAGNYDDFGLQGATNIPIDDTLAMRVAGYSETRSSFYDITTPTGGKYTGNPGDAHWGAGRLSLLWKPTEKLSVLFKTDFGVLDNGAYPGDPYSDRFKYLPASGAPNPFYEPDLFKIRANAPQQGQDDYVRSSLKIDYELPEDITLQSISSYQYGSTAYKADLYGNPNPIGSPYYDVTTNDTWDFADLVTETIYTQEVNLISSDKGFVTWVVGAFAQSDTYDFPAPATKDFVIGVPPGSPYSEYVLSGTNPERDLSAFGQLSFNLPAGFQVQLGGRYSSTSTKNDVYVDQYGLPLNDEQKAGSNNISYKAALNWTVDDANFLYAFVATGFKPGGLNVPVGLGQPAPFTDERDTDYEAGWKSTWFDDHLRTQVDAYYNNFHNFQVSIGYPAFPTFAFEVNDPNTTKLYGFEGETQAVFGQLSFDGGIGIEHSQLGTFFATDPRLATLGYPVTSCAPQTGPSSTSCVNLSGHAQTYAPNFTANFGVQYQFNLEGGDTLTPRLNFGHVSTQWATLFDNAALGDKLGVRNILNAQLAWVHGDYVVTLYGSNLTNDQYVSAMDSNLDWAGPPRLFGVRLMKAF